MKLSDYAPTVERIDQKSPLVKEFAQGTGAWRITAVSLKPGLKPTNLRSVYLVVEGACVSHPSVEPETPACLALVDVTDPMYGKKSIAKLMSAVFPDEMNLAQYTDKFEAWIGRTVKVSVQSKVYGPKSAKAGETFMAQDVFPSTTPAPASAPVEPAERWFDFKAPDPRAGVQQYNAKGGIRTL